MIKFLQNLWARISDFLLPDDYYAWQTLIYLGFFSFAMSWLARLVTDNGLSVNVIATAGWVFFALGVGWFLDKNNVRILGLPLAPWVMGAIICAYVFGTLSIGWQIGLMTWPLVSVAIVAIPQFLNWELRPKLPSPLERQQLILLTLIALLLSNWFQFYFRLQTWFTEYPSLLADDFSRSGFVFRLSKTPEEQARGIALLTAAQAEISESLNGTPWPYVERWLLNLDEKLATFEDRALNTLELGEEKDLWGLTGSTRRLDEGGYALDLMALWSGPTAMEGGYYLEKTCVIQPKMTVPPESEEAATGQATPLANVQCELATPKKPGRPTTI